MIVGSLGKIVFITSSLYTRTLDDLNIKDSAKWREIDIINGKPKLQFGGINLTNVTFTMRLSYTLNVNPERNIKMLHEIWKNGTVVQFVMGRKKVGNGKYVVNSVGQARKQFNAFGTVTAIEVNVELLEYN